MKESNIYTCVCTETLQREVEIEAESEHKALQKLEELYKDGKIILDYSDLIDTEFSNCKYTKKEISILNEISNFCKCDCGNIYNCAEEECVLFRIEKIIIEDKQRCCICGKIIDGYGNNAEPVKEGTCCDTCNEMYVIPARISGNE